MTNMNPTRKDLVKRIRDEAVKYDLKCGQTIADFFNYEAHYLYKKKSYQYNTIEVDSQRAFEIYMRALEIKYKK